MAILVMRILEKEFRRRFLFDDQIVSDEIGNHKYELPAKS